MRKLITIFLLAALCLSGHAQVGVADPGVYGAASSGPMPVEQWLMNEGSGQEFLTSSTSGDNLTGANITWASVTGFPGTVPVFNGSSTFATGTNNTNTNFDGTTPFSVSGWALITGFEGDGGTLIGNLTGGNQTGWEFGFNSAGGLFGLLLINNVGSGNFVQSAVSARPSTGAIHHFVATYNGNQNASGLTYYIDGVAQSSVTVFTNGLTASIANSSPVSVGERVSNSTDFFNGSMADVRIYNVELTSTQVSAIFTAGPQ
jgi:Concanavalin A-like lectin/glucanases superfamily